SGEQLLYSTEVVQSVRTNSIKGTYSTFDALNRMFQGTDVQVVQDRNDGSLTIRRRNAHDGAGNGTTTLLAGFGEIHGRVFNVSSGNFLSSARLAVQGTDVETLSGNTGDFRLLRV